MDYNNTGYNNTSSFGYNYGWGAAPATQQMQQPSMPQIKSENNFVDPKIYSQYQGNGTPSQKSVGYWTTPGTRGQQSSSTGTPTAMSNYFVPAGTPASASSGGNGSMRAGSFPRRSGGGWQKKTPVKKPFDPTGKTPAMLLHELFKDVAERYEEIPSTSPNKKSYRCVLTIQGKEYNCDAASKKVAKQKCAAVALQALRPDIKISPFEEKEVAPPTPAKVKVPKAEVSSSDAPPKKKQKMSPLESAVSLVDLMRKLCMEQEGLTPQMEYLDITDDPNARFHKRKFRFTLSFPEQGKKYVSEGIGKNSPKEQAVREALTDLFKVSQASIQEVAKKSILPRISTLSPIQVLFYLCSVDSLEPTFSVEEAEKKSGIDLTSGASPRTFVATCTLKDDLNKKEDRSVTGPESRSKAEARLAAAVLAIQKFFDLDIMNQKIQPVVAPVPASQKLNTLIVKQSRGKPTKITYEDVPLPPDAAKAEPFFKIKLTIEGKEPCFGVGRSKKQAKNAAAHAALKEIFKFDYNEQLNNNPEPSLSYNCSKLCMEVFEYAKREYCNMCSFYAVRPSTEMAAFFLLNEKNEKRLVAVGSSPQVIVNSDQVVTGEGQVLNHIQSIVLARRSLIRYLILEMGKIGEEGCIIENAENGMVKLKDSLRLVLYSTFAPDVKLSGLEDVSPKLATYLAAGGGIEPAPDSVQTIDEIKSKGHMRVHCMADKLFKWAHLGVQGGLLSNTLKPVLLSGVFFGAQGTADEFSYKRSFSGRLGVVQENFIVESSKLTIPHQPSVAHLWTRDMEHVESLNLETGRTNKGSASRVARSEIFQAFLKVKPDLASLSYAEAKAKAEAYQEMKKMLYGKLADLGQGQWQVKPRELSSFKLAAFD